MADQILRSIEATRWVPTSLVDWGQLATASATNQNRTSDDNRLQIAESDGPFRLVEAGIHRRLAVLDTEGAGAKLGVNLPGRVSSASHRLVRGHALCRLELFLPGGGVDRRRGSR